MRYNASIAADANTSPAPIRTDAETAREAIAERGFWYHTLELAPGVETPGWFDLRPIATLMPWPDIAGKRCLDVGPYDGFIAFELERRGASEVIAADISHPSEWDWAPTADPREVEHLVAVAGADPGGGFETAKRLLGSNVERVEINAYDLTPERLGSFDVVTCGSLLLHLRDPVRALTAIHGVCGGQLLSAEEISLVTTLVSRRRALYELRAGERCQWWIPNPAAHLKLLRAAGFEMMRHSRPYAIPLAPAHPSFGRRERPLKRLAKQVVARGQGVPHVAVLARAVR